MSRIRYEVITEGAFLILVLLSLFFLGYTIYLFYGTKFALNGLEVDFSKIEITSESSEKHVTINLELKNSYWVGLKIKYISLALVVNGRLVGSRQQFFSQPFQIPPYSTQNLNLSLVVASDLEILKGSICTLQIKKIIFITPLSKEAEVSRTITKVI